MRKYQEIWEKLKTNEKVILEVHPIMVPRVRKAVIKEKYNDLGFKIINDHDNFFLKFTYFRETKRLHIKLCATLGIEGVRK